MQANAFILAKILLIFLLYQKLGQKSILSGPKSVFYEVTAAFLSGNNCSRAIFKAVIEMPTGKEEAS